MFNIVLDKLMKEWENELKKKIKVEPYTPGKRKQAVNVPNLAFSDDLEIITRNPEKAIKQNKR